MSRHGQHGPDRLHPQPPRRRLLAEDAGGILSSHLLTMRSGLSHA